MEKKKDFGVIFVDAQIILHRNWCMTIKHQRDVITDDEGECLCHPSVFNWLVQQTIRSVMYSFRKILRAYSCNKIILLWDRQPYYNAQKIKDIYAEDTYKADRDYADDSIASKLFEVRQAAKYYIINNYSKFGFQSYIREGYEADYLGRICATISKGKNALASHDSDWPYYLTPDCPELISTTKFTLTYYDKVKEACLGADPWTWQVFHSSFYGSHNNLQCTVAKEYYNDEFEETWDKYNKGIDLDKVFSDWKLLVAQLESWNIESFPDYELVKSELTELINQPIIYAPEMDWIRDKSGLDLSFYREIKKLLS